MNPGVLSYNLSVEPNESVRSRVRVSDTPEILRIDILAPRGPVIVAGISALLIVFLYGVVRYWPSFFGAASLQHGIVTEGLFVVCAFGGIMAAAQLLYILMGTETVELSSSGIQVQVSIGWYSTSLHYALHDIRRLRYDKSRVWSMPGDHPGSFLMPLQIGKIRFDCGGRTVRFGVGLTDSEAQLVLDRISVRLLSFPEAGAPQDL